MSAVARKHPTLLAVGRDRDERGTPQWLFDEWDARFNFTLDACASPNNAKVSKFFTAEDDGLTQDWGRHRVWCNPPYSEIHAWVGKALAAAKGGATVVMLLPVSTSTTWFHDVVLRHGQITFLRGRVRFEGQASTAPFSSMVVVFLGGIG